jgi:predicted solute-binding protein
MSNGQYVSFPITFSTLAGYPQQRAEPRLAAVSYLNMMPFFRENKFYSLLPTPQLLNNAHASYDAYCSSLVAGLRAGKTPLSSRFGVFSTGPVMSVFIEPMLHNDAHTAFWKQMKDFWFFRHSDPIGSLAHTQSHGTIVLQTSGESAQSVWMFQILCALAGFKVELNSEVESLPVDPAGKLVPAARLFIGDSALHRRLAAPDSFRLDIGELWTQHTGHTAWFAAWFSGHENSELSGETLQVLLEEQLNVWSDLSEFSRWCSCFEFLERQQSPLLTSRNSDSIADVREMLNDYFSSLQHKISPEQEEGLLQFYLQIMTAFDLWSAAQSSNLKITQEKDSGLPHSHFPEIQKTPPSEVYSLRSSLYENVNN